MQREKMKYQKPVIHSVEVGQILPIAVSVTGGGNASEGGGAMQSKPYDLWEYDDETYDDETAFEDDW